MRLLRDLPTVKPRGVVDVVSLFATIGFSAIVLAIRQARPYRGHECGTVVEPGTEKPQPEGEDVVQTWE